MRVLELHATMRSVKRSEGRSAVGASAYITRTAMEDERTGERYDYRQKGGIEQTGLLLQDEAPDTFQDDRRKLWNSLEASAKRKDAQTAREFEISMPHEFSAAQRREAALKIGQMLLRRNGGAVEYALHTPGGEGDCRNHHAHFLFSAKKFDENGQWAGKGRMVEGRFVSHSPLDDLKRRKTEVEVMRAEIATIQNDIATRDGVRVYVEHLSFATRGLDREATQHMGANAMRLERRGQNSDIGDKNRSIRAGNEERRQNVIDIEQARAALKRQQEEKQPPPSPALLAQEARYEAFYADTYQRRAATLDRLQGAYGQQEKSLRQEAARLQASLGQGRGFAGFWRGITGRTRAEREQLVKATARLQEIAAAREKEKSDFERDRLQRLEALKRENQRALMEEQALPRAVGESRRAIHRDAPEARARVEQPALKPVAAPMPAKMRPEAGNTSQTAAPAKGGNEAARRREYFRRVGMQNKRQREQAQQRDPERAEETNQFHQPQPDKPIAAEPQAVRDPAPDAAGDPPPVRKQGANEAERRRPYFRQRGAERKREAAQEMKPVRKTGQEQTTEQRRPQPSPVQENAVPMVEQSATPEPETPCAAALDPIMPPTPAPAPPPAVDFEKAAREREKTNEQERRAEYFRQIEQQRVKRQLQRDIPGPKHER